MYLSTISSDLLLVHLVPLLNEREIRTLAMCNKSLAVILGPLRFRACSVRTAGGYFRMNLLRSTIKTIRELSLNGSPTEHDDVFQCRDLAGVESAIIVSPIMPRQIATFSMWSRRLTRLRESAVREGEVAISSLANLAAGSLHRVNNLRLDVSIPTRFETMLSIARNLRRIQFLPEQLPGQEGYIDYLRQINELVALLQDSERLPALKILHITPCYISERQNKGPHQQMLQNIFAAALSHGGWRLQCYIPSSEPNVPYPAAWAWWWGTHGLGFTITLKEARQFVAACLERDIYPSMERYVKGPIHIQTGGGTARMGTLPGTAIYGVWIHHGPTTDMTAALRLVTLDTKILSICMHSYWGCVGSLIPDALPYANVEGLLFDGPFPDHDARLFRYSNNLCVSFIKGIDLSKWTRLVNLTLPAFALQRGPVGGVPFISVCGMHIGGYDMHVLETLTTLKALSINQWFSCTECHLHPDVKFETGMTRIPPNVEYVAVSGRMGYHGEQIPEWMKFHAGELRRILQANRENVLVCCRRLYLERLSTDARMLCAWI